MHEELVSQFMPEVQPIVRWLIRKELLSMVRLQSIIEDTRNKNDYIMWEAYDTLKPGLHKKFRESQKNGFDFKWFDEL